jgi:hypothetical protein
MEQVARVDRQGWRSAVRWALLAGVFLGIVIVALLLRVRLCACAGPFTVDQLAGPRFQDLTLQPGATVGQTFVARRAGLAGLEVYLIPDQAGDGELRLHLRGGPQSVVDLAAARLPLAAVTQPGFYRFSFAPQGDSQSHSYYALLELNGPGRVAVGQAPADSYLDGALYQNGSPSDVQLASRLIFDIPYALLGYAFDSLIWLAVIGMAALIFVVPGWALLSLFWPGISARPVSERLALAGGIGLTIYPLVLLWADVIGWRLSAFNVWLPVGASLAVLLWRARSWRPAHVVVAGRTWAGSAAFWPDLVLGVITAAIVVLRFRAIRHLEAPMWGDSLQHTMIAQLLIDNGGLFDSWAPYVPYSSLSVQFGFPAVVAGFSWATGVDSVAATLWVGQILMVLAVLAIYPLACRLAYGNRWAGVGAVLVAGLLSTMPAFYVNWGRYAQLAGQVALPVLLWLLCDLLERERISWCEPVLVGAVATGMTLAYYRMPFYVATFALAWLIGWALPRWRADVRRWGWGAARLAASGVVALLLVLPWALHVSSGRLADRVEAGLTTVSPLAQVLADYRTWDHLLEIVPWPVLALAIAGFIGSLALRRWQVAMVAIWVLGLASIVAGRLIKLPGASLMQSFAVIIALYIPAALLAGWLVGWVAEQVERRTSLPPQILIGAVLLASLGRALWSPMEGPSATFVYVTRPDIKAMSWIREHTAPDARFLVEGFRINAGTSAVGADAGWWIPLLAGRQNTMPPQYALLNEAPLPADYTRRIVDLVMRLEREPLSESANTRLLCEWGITHVYVGQGQGRVGLAAAQLFTPQQLAQSPLFNLVYHQDRVSIFALNGRACDTNG